MSFVHEFVQGTSPWTLLMLHGTGGNERDLLPLGRTLAPDWSLLSPLGKVLEGSAPRFFRRFAEGVFDMEDLVFRTNELADWLEVAYGERGIDPNRVVAVGYSNGATIVSSLMMLRPGALRGGIALRPSVPAVPEPMPSLTGKSILLMPGRDDQIVPASQAEEVAALLRQAGADATIHQIAAGHGLTSEDISRSQAWLASLTA